MPLFIILQKMSIFAENLIKLNIRLFWLKKFAKNLMKSWINSAMVVKENLKVNQSTIKNV